MLDRDDRCLVRPARSPPDMADHRRAGSLLAGRPQRERPHGSGEQAQGVLDKTSHASTFSAGGGWGYHCRFGGRSTETDRWHRRAAREHHWIMDLGHLKAELDRLAEAIEHAGGRVTERDLNYIEDSAELFYERDGKRYEIHLKRLPDPP